MVGDQTMNRNKLKDLIQEEIDFIRGNTGGIALMASGGIDSGVLMALSDPDLVFTVRLPYGPQHDEYNDFVKSAKHIGIKGNNIVVVDLDEKKFDEYVEDAVKIIGRPIPHFNIFPLYTLFKKASEKGVTDMVCGDGPDETMAGYTRHLIMKYLYQDSRNVEAFKGYEGMIYKALGSLAPQVTYAMLIGKDISQVSNIFDRNMSLIDNMCRVDMELMRPDMDDMGDRLARHFGITMHRPYQDRGLDKIMFDLDENDKVQGEYGKYLLREVAEELLPEDVAWRKKKIGGPLVPVNKIKNWDVSPFDKSKWLKHQEEILASAQ